MGTLADSGGPCEGAEPTNSSSTTTSNTVIVSTTTTVSAITVAILHHPSLDVAEPYLPHKGAAMLQTEELSFG
jgi:hypothetical protein